MRTALIAIVASIMMVLFGASPGMALPADGSSILGSVNDTSNLESARTFCYNRYTGRFINWGRCRRRVVQTRPRVFCYNRYSGRFLHWGSCRR